MKSGMSKSVFLLLNAVPVRARFVLELHHHAG